MGITLGILWASHLGLQQFQKQAQLLLKLLLPFVILGDYNPMYGVLIHLILLGFGLQIINL